MIPELPKDARELRYANWSEKQSSPWHVVAMRDNSGNHATLCEKIMKHPPVWTIFNLTDGRRKIPRLCHTCAFAALLPLKEIS